MTDVSKFVTGTIFIRDIYEPGTNLLPDGRQHRWFIGICAMPTDVVNQYPGEHQFAFGGTMDGANLTLTLLGEGVDLTRAARGLTADGLLRLPVWRH